MEALIILALILLNGVFAMAEIAVVSSNAFRLEQRAAGGSRGARMALSLSRNPNRFLATVQIDITLVGVFAGAFGGATLAEPVARVLARWAWLEPYSQSVAFVLVVVAITYLSLVIGELVPKRVALNDPEAIAARLALPMHALSVLATPLVRFLSGSTQLVVRLLRVRPKDESGISEEELDLVLAQGRRAGVIEPAEHEIIENAFWLGERRVNDIMTPRHRVRWLDLAAGESEVRMVVAAAPHSQYLVSDGELDEVAGFVRTSELLAADLTSNEVDLRETLRRPLIVPESMPILSLLERFKETGVHLAAVVDEHGSVAGIATLSDILEELVGEVDLPPPGGAPDIVQRDDEAWTVAGSLHVDRLLEALSLEGVVDLSEAPYQTVGGLVADRLARIPEEGDAFTWRGFQLTVEAMDGLRVDRVRVERAYGDEREDGGSEAGEGA